MWLAALAIVACSSEPVELGSFTITDIEVGGDSMTVAVAASAAERSRGLRAVSGLPRGLDGMVFVFDEPRPATFTMEDTLIPLDIWWFDVEGILYDSATMIPCVDSACPVYPSPDVIGWALETPAGEVELEVGDRLSFPDG